MIRYGRAAQVTIKVANFAVTLRDGTVLELESADAGGVEGLVRAINGRVAR
jgi:hypothetical protein